MVDKYLVNELSSWKGEWCRQRIREEALGLPKAVRISIWKIRWFLLTLNLIGENVGHTDVVDRNTFTEQSNSRRASFFSD